MIKETYITTLDKSMLGIYVNFIMFIMFSNYWLMVPSPEQDVLKIYKTIMSIIRREIHNNEKRKISILWFRVPSIHWTYYNVSFFHRPTRRTK